MASQLETGLRENEEVPVVVGSIPNISVVYINKKTGRAVGCRQFFERDGGGAIVIETRFLGETEESSDLGHSIQELYNMELRNYHESDSLKSKYKVNITWQGFTR